MVVVGKEYLAQGFLKAGPEGFDFFPGFYHEFLQFLDGCLAIVCHSPKV